MFRNGTMKLIVTTQDRKQSVVVLTSETQYSKPFHILSKFLTLLKFLKTFSPDIAVSFNILCRKCLGYTNWFKHILFITRHDKGIGQSKKLIIEPFSIGGVVCQWFQGFITITVMCEYEYFIMQCYEWIY